jgi:prepilin-type N-terminal cleavage/methylation domain-containing protein
MNILNLKKHNPGFTLLEILVVISIIGILIALGASAYSVAQQKGRDARRQGDIKQMQNAFEQYYAANDSVYDACNIMAASTFPAGSLPTDPKAGSSYTCEGDVASYCACAELESGTGNSSSSDCAYAAGDFFCVSNLQ